MPRKPTSPPIGQATLSPAGALEMLTTQVERGAKLPVADESALQQWISATQHWVDQAFGENSSKATEFSSAGPVVFGMDSSAYYRDVLRDKLNVLRAFTSVLTDTVRLAQTTGAPPALALPTKTSKRIFVVHGHDDGAKETVARFIEKLGLEPIILQEQANGGRTLIEKFEAHADVAFAVVLLTPDDRGGTAAASYEDQKPRARQNVILELGYFVGRLGRGRVCPLYAEGTEKPSDIDGVAYVALDRPGLWRFQLAKELKEIFPEVEMNKI